RARQTAIDWGRGPAPRTVPDVRDWASTSAWVAAPCGCVAAGTDPPAGVPPCWKALTTFFQHSLEGREVLAPLGYIGGEGLDLACK
ncbi:hypothetical protein THAOC_22127, partial [Thalassiosira oceanica]